MRAIPIVDTVDDTLLTADGRKAVIHVTTTLDQDDDLEPGDPILAVIDEGHENSGLRVSTIGHMSLDRVFGELVEDTFAKGELIGILTALVIMLAVFGAVVAALIPVLLAVVAVLTAVGIIAVITMIWELNEFTLYRHHDGRPGRRHRLHALCRSALPRGA